MEIQPTAQLLLYLRALLLGAVQGVAFELLVTVRILLGAYHPAPQMQARYAKRLPLLAGGIAFPKPKKRQAWRFFVTFVTDVLFCIGFACSLILLLYAYHDGAWRLAVFALSLFGFALCRASFGRLLSIFSAWLAYVFAVIAAYCRALTMALCHLLFAALKALLGLVQAPVCALRGRFLKRRSTSLCRAQLKLASAGLWAPVSRKEVKNVKTKKGQTAPAMGDLHSDPGDLLRGSSDLCQSTDGMEPAAKRKRRTGAAKRRA